VADEAVSQVLRSRKGLLAKLSEVRFSIDVSFVGRSLDFITANSVFLRLTNSGKPCGMSDKRFSDVGRSQ